LIPLGTQFFNLIILFFSPKGSLKRIPFLLIELSSVFLTIQILVIYAINFTGGSETSELEIRDWIVIIFMMTLLGYIETVAVIRRLRDLALNPWWTLLLMPLYLGGKVQIAGIGSVMYLIVRAGSFFYLLLAPSRNLQVNKEP
jgi:uncharacterized membrane protein YhaH (DUF805 family)